MQNLKDDDFIWLKAEAIANGIEIENFEIFCLLNDLEENSMSLKLFINQQLKKECGNKARSQNSCFFIVKFIDYQGKPAKIVEKKEVEARKLYVILKTKNSAEMFKFVNGVEQKIC